VLILGVALLGGGVAASFGADAPWLLVWASDRVAEAAAIDPPRIKALQMVRIFMLASK
jgi:hypothetical protein